MRRNFFRYKKTAEPSIGFDLSPVPLKQGHPLLP